MDIDGRPFSDSESQTLQTSGNGCLQLETLAQKRTTDNADNADIKIQGVASANGHALGRIEAQPASPSIRELINSDPAKHLEEALAFLFRDGETFEICGMKSRTRQSVLWEGFAGDKSMISGCFTDRKKAIDLILKLDREVKPEAIYVSLNPCNPELKGRAHNRLKASIPRTKDEDILSLNTMLIDLDPKRAAGISSTNEELAAAHQLSSRINDYLRSQGWPEPLIAQSGNGVHLLFKLPELPNTPGNKDLIHNCLKALAEMFNTDRVEVDTTTFNPARITKFYGTAARKGDNIPERPHRRSRILSVPTKAEMVRTECILRLASFSVGEEVKSSKREDSLPSALGAQNPGFDLEGFLQEYKIEVLREKQHGDSTLFILKKCIFDDSHSGGEASVGRTKDGKLFYQCFHNSCQSKTWSDVRAKICGGISLQKFAPRTRPSKDSDVFYSNAAGLFPRTDFPWHILPGSITESLNQLARSCATSANHLPGVAFSLVASCIGRCASVSPKSSWKEPFIIWYADIRQSGDGKSPPAEMMSRVLYAYQKKEHDRHDREMMAYRLLPKKDRDRTPPPLPPRSYCTTDLTMEGLREALSSHPHGGIIVIQDELSSFLSSQNQYKKQGGNDREAWLSLHSGSPARIMRVGKSLFISGARVSVFGGIQPAVFSKAFGGRDGLYMVDGTAFRFLYSYEPSRYRKHIAESWDEKKRAAWDKILEGALSWSDKRVKAGEPHLAMILDVGAQNCFLDWANRLEQSKESLSGSFKGFIPKALGYALRLTGVIHCMWRFDQGMQPSTMLTVKDVERGIEAVEFYLGQAIDAMRLLKDPEYYPQDISEFDRQLARTLDALRSQVDNGRLAVGFIMEQYNSGLRAEQKISKPKVMGTRLRSLGLTMSAGKHDANGRRAVSCLLWDEKTENFIKERLHSLQCLQSEPERGFVDTDVQLETSATSSTSAEKTDSEIACKLVPQINSPLLEEAERASRPDTQNGQGAGVREDIVQPGARYKSGIADPVCDLAPELLEELREAIYGTESGTPNLVPPEISLDCREAVQLERKGDENDR